MPLLEYDIARAIARVDANGERAFGRLRIEDGQLVDKERFQHRVDGRSVGIAGDFPQRCVRARRRVNLQQLLDERAERGSG